MEFNELLKNARKRANKTLEEVAKDCGVSKATVQRWESGEIKNVRRDKISKLAASLNITPSYLMGWEENEFLKYNEEDITYLTKHNPDLLDLYHEIQDNEQLVILFDKAKKLNPQDLAQVLKIIDTFNNENK